MTLCECLHVSHYTSHLVSLTLNYDLEATAFGQEGIWSTVFPSLRSCFSQAGCACMTTHHLYCLYMHATCTACVHVQAMVLPGDARVEHGEVPLLRRPPG
jgi:hypothetical protein